MSREHVLVDLADGRKSCPCGLVFRPGADPDFEIPPLCGYALLREPSAVEGKDVTAGGRPCGERTVIDPPRSRTWPAGVRVHNEPSPEEQERRARAARVRTQAERQRGLSPLRPPFWRSGMPEPVLYWSKHWKMRDFVDRAFTVSPRKIHLAAEILRGGRAMGSEVVRADPVCSLCAREMSSSWLTDGRFTWPGGAEHYVLGHAVWTPELEVLVEGLPLPDLGAVRLPRTFRDRCERWA